MTAEAPLIRDQLNHAVNARVGSSGLFAAFDWFKVTDAEDTAGVTPLNYSYPPGDVRRYGAPLNGSGDDSDALEAAILTVYTQGGGRVFGFSGSQVKSTRPITVLDRVVLDLEFSTVKPYLSGSSDYGFRPRSYAQILNGTIAVQSSGSPGSQGGYHAPIKIGPFYGEGGTVASPSLEEGVTGIVLRNLILSTTATDHVAIGILGGANNILIENITVPDSSVMSFAIGADWGVVGSISSTTTEMYNNSVTYLAGNAYTTHPNNITFKNIRIGNLSRASGEFSSGIRFSAVHNVTVENVNIAGTQYSGVFHTAGDLGYEFAQAAVRPFAHKNVVVRNVNIEDANNGWGYFVDANADNVIAGQSINQTTSGVPYVPMIDPYAELGMVLERCITSSDAGASTVPGFRVQNLRGLAIIDCQARGHSWGIVIENAAHKVKVVRGRYCLNRNDGIYINGTERPIESVLEDVFCDRNGQDGAYTNPAGVKLDGATRAKIIRGKFGADGYAAETTQRLGVHAASTACTQLTVRDCYVQACKATTGIAYGMGASSSDYGVLDVFSGNRAAETVATFYSGVDIIPSELTLSPATGLPMRKCYGAGAITPPTAGTWHKGDQIWLADPAASTSPADFCVTAGTFSAATDNTGDTDGSTAVITGMADTSDFFVGEYVTCSAGFASTGPFMILAKTASTMTVGATSNSVQANITVATPDPVFKSVAALSA